MTAGFGELLRERGMERVRDEIGAFFGAYGEAATGALYEGDFGALERSTDEFVAALKRAIPSWVEGKTVAKGAAAGQAQTEKNRGSGAVTTTFTKGDVRETANALAKKKIEAEPQRFGKMGPKEALASARREVWGENPDLVRLHEQAELEAVAAPEAPVQKGADVLAEADREARELMKTDPERYAGKSVEAVRSVVWSQKPDLAERYQEALRS